MVLLETIIQKLKPEEFVGNKSQTINEIIQLQETNRRDDVLFWCNEKNVSRLKNCTNGVVVCSLNSKGSVDLDSGCNYIFVHNPRLYFVEVLKNYFAPQSPEPVISSRASVHSSARIGRNVFIGDFTVIEQNVVIGDNTHIGYNNTILSDTSIGSNVKIGSNNIIGGVGFGYERNAEGDYELMPHIGNVVLKDNVEIGNSTCIDRAVIGSTLLEENVKVDNLVHIAHGVVIGKNTLVIANAMIGGSTIIGENSWIAPSASIINKIEIGSDSIVGMGSVVIKSVPDNEVVAGNPAKSLKK